MVNSKPFQLELEKALQRHFRDVQTEWPISTGATDALARSRLRYAPRLDLAVGPFSVQQGNRGHEMMTEFASTAPRKLRDFTRTNLGKNGNPRCAMAIEISFSGSSKHMLGDIANASMIGLYGFVIANDGQIGKLKRILEYVNAVQALGKLHMAVFNNVAVMSTNEFMDLL